LNRPENRQNHNAGKGGRIRREARLVRVIGPVLLLTGIFLLHFMARQIAGPLLPAMEAELDLTHFQGGLFILFMGVGFFLGQIGAAALASRFGYRRCILASLWVSAGTTAAL
jgi:fucose permease